MLFRRDGLAIRTVWLHNSLVMKCIRTKGVKPVTEYRICWIDDAGDIIDCDHWDTEAEARKHAASPIEGAVKWEIEKVRRICYTDPATMEQSWDIDSEPVIASGNYDPSR